MGNPPVDTTLIVSSVKEILDVVFVELVNLVKLSIFTYSSNSYRAVVNLIALGS